MFPPMAVDPSRTDRIDARINQLGGALMFDKVTIGHASEQGIDNVLALYVVGRAGAMGDVNLPSVLSAFAFLSPELITNGWQAGQAYGTPSQVAAVFAAAMAESGRQNYDPQAAATFAEIGRKLADSVTPIGHALFSGWQAMTVPSDPGGAAALTVMTLRELRGDVNIHAMGLTGLSPLEADLACAGEKGVQVHGWKPPFPDVSHATERAAAATAQTSQRMAQIYDTALGAEELDRFEAAVNGLLPGS